MSDARATVTELTVEDLTRIMRESAGEDESIDLDGDILDSAFTDLGYDSLALLETTGRIARDYGVELSDDILDGIETPREFLTAVNQSLAAA
ncbi:acyl carrier protein [Streptomyces pilosus]|uniref:Actinorhodin polyketide synthase acyl carrier protein n=1 Tax=Streptomyces pilosus TaxID=28893 RepID=A0A918C587_9ACTN|nr:acyl carrier protein [Streptomyces pilosus]GGR06440.1 actinorhodin polyketide synthase acyl carrier protein [Streptomyces pilosus]GGV68997.1 actinorhodin polyketide synthase acyl carrier protein [Streptomyces pilosus]